MVSTDAVVEMTTTFEKLSSFISDDEYAHADPDNLGHANKTVRDEQVVQVSSTLQVVGNFYHMAE